MLNNLTLLVFIILTVATTLSYGQDVPNPSTSPTACGLSEAGYVCDPEAIFSSADRDDINDRLTEFNTNAACGQCLAVLTMRKVQSGISTTEAHKQTRQLAVWLTGSTEAKGHWGFTKCKRLAVIVLNRDQRYVWFQAGPDAGLCHEIDGIFAKNKAPFSRKHYGDGINAMIGSYIQLHTSTYTSSSDCNTNTYPCKSSNEAGSDLTYKTTDDLLRHLPNPEDNPRPCQILTGGYLCDPEQVLTEPQRSELSQSLQKFRQNECDQCVAVALLKDGLAKHTTLTDTFKSLQKQWRFARCKGVLTIFMSMANKFVWMNGDADTVQCSKITNIYNEHKHRFASREIFDGLMSIIGSYAEQLTSSCSNRTCERTTGSSEGSGVGGGMGSKVLGKAKDIALRNKKLAIAMVVGVLLIVGLGLCCGCIFCREKTMGAVKSLGALATTQMPKLASRFGNKGGGGAAATGGAGGSWGAQGGGNGASGGTTAGGGGGGTWANKPPSAPGGGDDGEGDPVVKSEGVEGKDGGGSGDTGVANGGVAEKHSGAVGGGGDDGNKGSVPGGNGAGGGSDVAEGGGGGGGF